MDRGDNPRFSGDLGLQAADKGLVAVLVKRKKKKKHNPHRRRRVSITAGIPLYGKIVGVKAKGEW